MAIFDGILLGYPEVLQGVSYPAPSTAVHDGVLLGIPEGLLMGVHVASSAAPVVHDGVLLGVPDVLLGTAWPSTATAVRDGVLFGVVPLQKGVGAVTPGADQGLLFEGPGAVISHFLNPPPTVTQGNPADGATGVDPTTLSGLGYYNIVIDDPDGVDLSTIVINVTEGSNAQELVFSNGAFEPNYNQGSWSPQTGTPTQVLFSIYRGNHAGGPAWASQTVIQTETQAADAPTLQPPNIATTLTSFTTSDGTPPYVSDLSPANAGTAVTTTSLFFKVGDVHSAVQPTSIMVMVSANMGGPSGVVYDGFSGGFQGSWTGTVTPEPAINGYSLLINLPVGQAWGIGEVVTVDISASDTAVPANYFPAPPPWSFTVGDFVPPVISNELPSIGATGVLLGTDIGLTVTDFSGVDLSTLKVEVLGSIGTYGTAYDGSTQTFYPPFNGPSSAVTSVANGYDVYLDMTSTFIAGEQLQVNVDADDLAATPNSLIGGGWSFAVVDTAKPYVQNRSPGHLDTGVTQGTLVSFEIIDLGLGVDLASIIVMVTEGTANPAQAYSGGAFSFPYDGASSSVQSITNGYLVTIDRVGDYADLSTIKVRAYAADLAATPNTMDTEWQFVILDDDPPVIHSEVPARNATSIAQDTTVEFTIYDVSGVDPNSLVVQVTGPSGGLELAYNGGAGFQPNFDGGLSKLTPDPSVTPNSASYVVEVDPTFVFPEYTQIDVDVDVSDLYLPTQTQLLDSWSFTTGDTVAPYLTRHLPLPLTKNTAGDTTIAFSVVDNGLGTTLSSVSAYVAIDAGTPELAFDGAAEAATPGTGLQPAFNGPNASFAATTTGPVGFDIVLDPLVTYADGITIQVIVYATDMNGNLA